MPITDEEHKLLFLDSIDTISDLFNFDADAPFSVRVTGQFHSYVELLFPENSFKKEYIHEHQTAFHTIRGFRDGTGVNGSTWYNLIKEAIYMDKPIDEERIKNIIKKEFSAPPKTIKSIEDSVKEAIALIAKNEIYFALNKN